MAITPVVAVPYCSGVANIPAEDLGYLSFLLSDFFFFFILLLLFLFLPPKGPLGGTGLKRDISIFEKTCSFFCL